MSEPPIAPKAEWSGRDGAVYGISAAFCGAALAGAWGGFYTGHPIPGTILVIIGLSGFATMAMRLRGWRLGVLPFGIAAAILTWILVGYLIIVVRGEGITAASMQPTVASTPSADIEAAVAPVRAELNRANQDKITLQKQIERLSDPETPVFTNDPSLSRKLTHDEATSLIGLIDKLDAEMKSINQITYSPLLPWVKHRQWTRQSLTIDEQLNEAGDLQQKLNVAYDAIRGILNEDDQVKGELDSLLSSDSDPTTPTGPLRNAIDSLEHFRNDGNNIKGNPNALQTSQDLIECRMKSTADLVGNKLQFLFQWSNQVRQRIPQLREQASKFL